MVDYLVYLNTYFVVTGKRESLADNSACLFVCFTAQRGEREGATIKSHLAQPDLCRKSHSQKHKVKKLLIKKVEGGSRQKLFGFRMFHEPQRELQRQYKGLKYCDGCLSLMEFVNV